MRLEDLGDARGVEHVELLDCDARAQVRLQKIRLAAIGVIRDDDVLASVEQAARGMQADEAHPTDE